MARLDRLECVTLGGLRLRLAHSRRARLLGLALVAEPPREALLLPRCRSVHTAGMRFALDLVWIDARAQVVRADLGVGPWRVVGCREARAVIEVAAGEGERVLSVLRPARPA
jgi:uncharacterized protein